MKPNVKMFMWGPTGIAHTVLLGKDGKEALIDGTWLCSADPVVIRTVIKSIDVPQRDILRMEQES